MLRTRAGSDVQITINHIVLTKLSDGRTKTFFQAGGNEQGLRRHMESLTDDNCDGFFPAERKKKK